MRGWLGRVKTVHQIIFRAATDIQRTLSRGIQGRQRANNVYIERVEKEKIRRKKENGRIQSAVDRAVGSVRTLVETGGADLKKEIARAKKNMKKMDKQERKKTKSMTLQFQKRRAVEKIFKSFDVDGKSATIPMEALSQLLKALCLPMTEKETLKVLNILKSPIRPGDVNNGKYSKANAVPQNVVCNYR